MNIVFRNFHIRDLSEVEQMILGLYKEDVYGEPITLEKIRETFYELTQNPEKGRIIVFTLDCEIIGYAILIFYWSNEFGGNIIVIDELFVKPALRNQGIATQFFEYLSTQWQAKALQLEVTPSNPRALRYYQKLGFSISKNTHLIKKIETSSTIRHKYGLTFGKF